MARISLNPPRNLINRIVSWYSRRRFGTTLGPASAAGHNRGVLMTTLRMEQSSAKWRALDSRLKLLATMRAAATIECEWCMDFSHWLSAEAGLDAQKITAVPDWRRSGVYTPLERLVLEYAEAMTATPPTVTETLSSQLSEHLNDAQLVELTATIALENFYGRTNHALGIPAEGFAAECAVPAPPRQQT
jgi:alkylhydroperoxidase family enzyme